MKLLHTLGFLFVLCPWIFSQSYSLSNWTVEDGLSSNDITDILQDKEGFIWVSTEHGLNTFDGYTFRKHRYQPGDSTSIGANFINHICLDQQGDIWVNLAVGILSRYNQLSKSFRNFNFPKQQSHILDMRFVQGIGLCIATSEGVFVFDEEHQTLDSWEDKDKPGMPEVIYKIFPHPDKGFYASSDRGFLFYDKETDQFSTTYYINQKDTIKFEAFVFQHAIDTSGNDWIQTRHGAVCQSDNGIYFRRIISGPAQNNLKRKSSLFSIDKKQGTKYFLKNATQLLVSSEKSLDWEEFPLQKEEVGFSFTDRESNLWIFTANNQLKKWNGHQWQSIFDLNGQLSFWEVGKVFIDEENGIWFGSKTKGLWRIFNRQWPISVLAPKNTNEVIDFPITALLKTDDDYIWIGSFGKLYRYDPSTNEIHKWPASSQGKNPFANLNINDIAQSPNGDFWFATSRGIIQLSEDGKSYQHFKHLITVEQTREFGHVQNIIADQSGRLWLGNNKGLTLFEPLTEKFYHFKSGKIEDGLRANHIQCIYPIAGDSLLIGYVKDGVDLLVFDTINYQVHCQKIHYENSRMQQFDLMTANVFYPNDTEYWLGTFSKGLLKIDLKNLSMRPISEAFPIIPNIKDIQKDAAGNLWISSIDGIRSVNPIDHTFYRFTKSSGLLSNQFYMNSATSDSMGNLYFGSSKGLNKIEPNQWHNQDTLAKPIVTDFKKLDNSITFDTLLNELRQITLSHQDDFITFEFVSPTFDNSKDVQYAYQLAGFNDQWRYCETQRSATFTNLSPGHYTFKVRAGNKGGFLNSEIKQIQLFVKPPFWQTGWFGIIILAVLFLLWWLTYKIQQRIRLNRLRIATEIRQKAADDFHDELGHRLTKISLFVESLMLQKNKFPQTATGTLRKIQDNANELFHSTRDFIWAMSPTKDSALDLFILLRDFGGELFEDTEIHFSVEGFHERYKDYLLDMDWKRQLILIFKEAMNNALKHAECKHVILKIEEYKTRMQIVLIDDGKGFELDHEQFGYGLGSMLNRAKKIGGQLEIETASEQGTKIILKIKNE